MDANVNQVREPQNKIRTLDRGRFISKHAGGFAYYDSRHRVHKTALSEGFVGELVQERQPDGTYRDQLLTIPGACGRILPYRTIPQNGALSAECMK